MTNGLVQHITEIESTRLSSRWVPFSSQRRLKAAKGEGWAPSLIPCAQATMDSKTQKVTKNYYLNNMLPLSLSFSLENHSNTYVQDVVWLQAKLPHAL